MTENEISIAASHGITHPKKRAMLAALSQTGNVSAAARAAGIGRRTHYCWLDDDPRYVLAVEQAMEEAADVLEAVARKRAVHGSDLLLIFLLKAIRPEKFRERHHMEHAGDIKLQASVNAMRQGLIRLIRDHPELANILEAEALGKSLPAPKES